jgi:GntR family transcriptional repressor for pyruvate dehydrogenase complex
MKDLQKKPTRTRKPSKARATAVAEAARKLREIILERGDGSFLGSREELVQTLGVGHVTLQQAARLLERERLLFVRRGTNGGYFARVPDESGVEEVVATYLRARKVGFREAHAVASVLQVEMARLAARSRDEAGRSQLGPLYERIEKADLSDPRELMRLDTVHVELTHRLAANPLGELILLVTRRLFFEAGPGSLLRTLDDVEYWRRTRLSMLRAFQDHDEEYAELITRRFGARLSQNLDMNLRLNSRDEYGVPGGG